MTTEILYEERRCQLTPESSLNPRHRMIVFLFFFVPLRSRHISAGATCLATRIMAPSTTTVEHTGCNSVETNINVLPLMATSSTSFLVPRFQDACPTVDDATRSYRNIFCSRTLLPQLAYIDKVDRRLDTATVTVNYYMRYGANITGKTPLWSPTGNLPSIP